VEDKCSAPQTYEVWDRIFADMSQHGGLAVFKQDHGGGEIVQLEAAQRNVSVCVGYLARVIPAKQLAIFCPILCSYFLSPPPKVSHFWSITLPAT
jgi:hypothetical protein